MSISISQTAAERIKQIHAEQFPDQQMIVKVGVESGGCSGLTYALSFDEDVDSNIDGIQYFESEGIRLKVDMRSYLYLAGTELRYSDGLEGKGFHFENPNASRVCSCGESFSV